jgi:hypothetical protein
MRCTPPAGLPPMTRIVATGGAAGCAGAVCVPVVRAACVALRGRRRGALVARVAASAQEDEGDDDHDDADERERPLRAGGKAAGRRARSDADTTSQVNGEAPSGAYPGRRAPAGRRHIPAPPFPAGL